VRAGWQGLTCQWLCMSTARSPWVVGCMWQVGQGCFVLLVLILLICIGGWTGGYSTAVYALDGQAWTKIADMKYGRSGHSCAVLGNNLFLIGGYGAPKSVEIYNMVEETWNHEAAGLTSDLYYGHALVHDGRLYVVHTDGEVERMAAHMREWELVGSVGEWTRPAAIVTREMLNC
jgi:hypothetical protein